MACPSCGGDVRLIGFITQLETIWKVLTHLGESLEPPQVSPTRGPPFYGATWSRLRMTAVFIKPRPKTCL